MSHVAVFVCIGPLFANTTMEELYKSYATNHQGAIKLAQWRFDQKGSPFRKFVKETERKVARAAGKDPKIGAVGADFLSMLRLPVEHLTYQVNFLKGVVQYSKPTHSDVRVLNEWAEKSEQICSIDDQLIQNEFNEKRKIQALEIILEKIEHKEKKETFVTPGREFVSEGDIQLIDLEAKSTSIKEHYYFLFNDLLLITKKKKENKIHHNHAGPKYRLQLSLPLRAGRTKDIPNNQNFCGVILVNAWELHSSKKSIIMIATDALQKDFLLNKLNALCAALTEQASSV